MFFNMKIEVSGDQPLDEIVAELKRLGYRLISTDIDTTKLIITTNKGCYWIVNNITTNDRFFQETTLSELKEMKCSN